jgi:hypothetical protein
MYTKPGENIKEIIANGIKNMKLPNRYRSQKVRQIFTVNILTPFYLKELNMLDSTKYS